MPARCATSTIPRAPTHRPVVFSATDLDRFENGKIAEKWHGFGECGRLLQIGTLVGPD